MSKKKRFPVTILTGFLGAGKTTFLNDLIQRNPDTRYAIIENEFGEKSIDSELIFRPENGIVELNNGCLCCTLNDNLYDILNDLFERRNEFDEIIIEATGVADPAGLAEPFLSHPLIREHFPLIATVCLIDAELVEEQIEDTEEALSQITFSEILLLNKTDLVSKVYVKELREKMKNINPLAKIYEGNQDNFPDMDFASIKDNKKLDFFNELKTLIPTEGSKIEAPHRHHEHEHTKEIVSFCFTFDRAFEYDKLYHHLFVYLTFQSKSLFRIKGLLSLSNNDKQVVIQTVGKRMVFEEKREWKKDEKRESIIVFIGKNLKEKGLRQLLEKCIAKAENPNYESIY